MSVKGSNLNCDNIAKAPRETSAIEEATQDIAQITERIAKVEHMMNETFDRFLGAIPLEPQHGTSEKLCREGFLADSRIGLNLFQRLPLL